MIQIILNGERIGTMTEANAKTYLELTKMTVVSQTATTINLEG